jgi:hypothetical protein
VELYHLTQIVISTGYFGTTPLGAGQRAGALLEVLDEAARPRVEQAAADEIFSDPNRS